MAKKLPLIILLLVVGSAIWYFSSNKSGDTTVQNNTDTGAVKDASVAPVSGTTGDKSPKSANPEMPAIDEEALDDSPEARPATEVFKSADEALNAIKAGATDYDDLVLEQFTDLGPDCSWCDSFYTSVRELATSPETSADNKSYYAEVLSISGRLDNIESLVDYIKGAKSPEEADMYAEALELAVGKDDVVKFLATELNSDNQTLKESSVAAITNQGSLLSADILYKHTVERGDPDGYYSQGIGLGELIPDDSALPFLQDAVTKRDAYSHLAAKAMLNNGIGGLRRFIDVLESSSDGNFDKQLLNGLVDHVSYEDEVEALLKEKAENSSSQNVREFAKQALADFNIGTEEEGDTATE